MLSEETSKNLMPSPLPGAPNVGEGIIRPNAPALNPKMRKGLKRFAYLARSPST
jgi:hypothetical protein